MSPDSTRRRLGSISDGTLTYFILEQISIRPRFGQEVLAEVRRVSTRRDAPATSSVYPLLQRLVAQGFAKEEPVQGPGSDRLKFRATAKGAVHLEAAKKMLLTKTGGPPRDLRTMFLEGGEPGNRFPLIQSHSPQRLAKAKNLLEFNTGPLTPEERVRALAEYSLSIERQLGPVSRGTGAFAAKRPSTRARSWR